MERGFSAASTHFLAEQPPFRIRHFVAQGSQGCSLSPLLFVMFFELVADAVSSLLEDGGVIVAQG